jgi:hypothetical protein
MGAILKRELSSYFNSAVAYVTGADIDSGATSWGG